MSEKYMEREGYTLGELISDEDRYKMKDLLKKLKEKFYGRESERGTGV